MEEGIHSHNPYSPSKYRYYNEQTIIDKSLKGTKAECVFNKLKNNDIIKPFLNRFDGEFPVAHLELSIDNTLADNENGITRDPW